MITIFNRKELFLTYDMKKQSEIRTILQNHKIDYHVNVKNVYSRSPLGGAPRGRTETPGVDLNKSYEYKIYVRKEDYERAVC